VDDFVAKPVESADVRTRVAALLRTRRVDQELDRVLTYLHELETDRLRQRRVALATALKTPWPALPKGDAEIPLLLVSDETITLHSYRDLLTEHGFRVATAASGTDAIRSARAEAFEVAVLDTRISDTGWLEVLQSLRAVDSDLPVLMLSRQPMLQRALAALRAGATDLFVHGWDHNLLAITLHRMVSHRRELHQAWEENEQLRARLQQLEGGNGGSTQPPKNGPRR
jgi:DNA-binding response OmpR family regulator